MRYKNQPCYSDFYYSVCFSDYFSDCFSLISPGQHHPHLGPVPHPLFYCSQCLLELNRQWVDNTSYFCDSFIHLRVLGFNRLNI